MGCWQGVGSPPGHVGGFTLGELSVHFVRFSTRVLCHSRASTCAWGRAGLRRGRGRKPLGSCITPEPPGILDTGWAVPTGRLPGFADGDSLLLAAANTGLPHAIQKDGWPLTSEGNENATSYQHTI